MKNQLNITRGAEKKPAASSILEEVIREIPDMQGEFFYGLSIGSRIRWQVLDRRYINKPPERNYLIRFD